MILFANAPLFSRTPTGWLKGTLVQKPGSTDEYAVQLLSGDHLAVDPFGQYSTRPAGTFGAYETVRVRQNNLVLVYMFNGVDINHVIPFVGDL